MKRSSGIAARRIAEADARAEQLLGYARMVVSAALIIAILLAANSALRPDDPFIARQIGVGLAAMLTYFVIGASAVFLVRMGRFRPWMAWLYAAIDVMVITGNVLLGVLSSQGSSLFALAYPAALGLPIALAFGALRFRADVQVAATLATACLLVAIILSAPGGDAEIAVSLEAVTATYAVPPNMVRIVMLLSTGFLIAIAVWRGRRLLESAVSEAEARANLTRFLPEGVADDMSDEAVSRLRAGRRAKVGVLFIDIRGFTAMADGMAPEAAGAILADYRAHVLDAATAHNGVVDKFIGDGALLLFGLETETSGAQNALRAAETLARQFEGGDYRVGIGVHFGEAMIGAVGDERRLEFTVIGDVVNIASRIEQMTKDLRETALCSAETITAAGDGQRRWAAVGAQEVRGRREPLEIWALRG